MSLQKFVVVWLAGIVLACGSAGAAELEAVTRMPELSANAAKIIVTEGDISDRPYRVLGQVFVRAKKVGIIDRPPIEEKIDILLRADAAELGADAVINVRRERNGLSVFNFGYMDGIGTAVAFGGGGNAAAIQQAVPDAPASEQSSSAPQAAARPPVVAISADPLKSFLSGVNAGDTNAIIALFADDAVIEDPAGSRPIAGRGAVESYVAGLTARGARYEMVMPVGNSGMGAAAMAVRVHTGGGVESTIHTFTYGPNGTISKLTIYRDPTLR